MIVFFVADEGTTEDISEFRIGIENTTSEKLIGLCKHLFDPYLINFRAVPSFVAKQLSRHHFTHECVQSLSIINRAKADPIALPAYFVFKVRHMQWAIP